MSGSLIDKMINSIFDADWVGRRGEKLTERELKLVQLFGRKGRVLRNVYVPREDGGTTEIDVLFITQKGIFVIESKNYSGWIFGDETSLNWTVMLPNRTKNRFYNPIKQNRGHIKWLGRYLQADIPMFSIIVFAERCELKKVTVVCPDIQVIKRDRLYAAVRDIWDAAADKLSAAEVSAIYEQLAGLTNADAAVKAAHVAAIEQQYKQTDAKKQQVDDIELTADSDVISGKSSAISVPDESISAESDEAVCPKCGGQLVLRTARKGARAGSSFYGCTNYPRCRFTRN